MLIMYLKNVNRHKNVCYIYKKCAICLKKSRYQTIWVKNVPKFFPVHAHHLGKTGGRSCMHLCVNSFCLLVHVAVSIKCEYTDYRIPKRTDPHIYFGVLNFKKAYLLNRSSEFRSVFTAGTLATRSLKLDPAWVYFDEIFSMPTFVLYGATLVLYCATLILYRATFFKTYF